MSLRALDTDAPLTRYFEIKAEIERLTDELNALKPEITEALHHEPEHRCLYLGCEVTLGIRRSYRYSPELEAQEKALKQAKEVERLTGAATVTRVSHYPVIKPIKREAA